MGLVTLTISIFVGLIYIMWKLCQAEYGSRGWIAFIILVLCIVVEAIFVY